MKNWNIILLRSVAIQILYAGSSPVQKQLKPSAAFRDALASSQPHFLGGGCFCPCFVSWLSTDTGRYNGFACIWLFRLCLSVQSCRLRWFNVQMWVLVGLEKWDLESDSVNVFTSVPACPSAQGGRTGPKPCPCDCALNVYTLVESTVFCISISCSLPSGSQWESKLCVKCTYATLILQLHILAAIQAVRLPVFLNQVNSRAETAWCSRALYKTHLCSLS